jgi:hypothetical protein
MSASDVVTALGGVLFQRVLDVLPPLASARTNVYWRRLRVAAADNARLDLCAAANASAWSQASSLHGAHRRKNVRRCRVGCLRRRSQRGGKSWACWRRPGRSRRRTHSSSSSPRLRSAAAASAGNCSPAKGFRSAPSEVQSCIRPRGSRSRRWARRGNCSLRSASPSRRERAGGPLHGAANPWPCQLTPTHFYSRLVLGRVVIP